MMNPKQIPEEDIKFRVAKALFPSDASDDRVWAYISASGYDPLNKPDELCHLLMDNWEGIVSVLDHWFTATFPVDGGIETECIWSESDLFLENKELWILRALVAYKEGEQ